MRVSTVLTAGSQLARLASTAAATRRADHYLRGRPVGLSRGERARAQSLQFGAGLPRGGKPLFACTDALLGTGRALPPRAALHPRGLVPGLLYAAAAAVAELGAAVGAAIRGIPYGVACLVGALVGAARGPIGVQRPAPDAPGPADAGSVTRSGARATPAAAGPAPAPAPHPDAGWVDVAGEVLALALAKGRNEDVALQLGALSPQQRLALLRGAEVKQVQRELRQTLVAQTVQLRGLLGPGPASTRWAQRATEQLHQSLREMTRSLLEFNLEELRTTLLAPAQLERVLSRSCWVEGTRELCARSLHSWTQLGLPAELVEEGLDFAAQLLLPAVLAAAIERPLPPQIWRRESQICTFFAQALGEASLARRPLSPGAEARLAERGWSPAQVLALVHCVARDDRSARRVWREDLPALLQRAAAA